jgi:hypothetical protein
MDYWFGWTKFGVKVLFIGVIIYVVIQAFITAPK